MKRSCGVGLLFAIAIASCSAAEQVALRRKLLGRPNVDCGDFATAVRRAHEVNAARDQDPPADLLQLCAMVEKTVRDDPSYKDTCLYDNYERPFPPVGTRMVDECTALRELRDSRAAAHAKDVTHPEEERIATEQLDRERDRRTILSADTAALMTDCAALTTIISSWDDHCWRALAENEVRVVGRDAKTLANEDGLELGTLQDAAGFPFEFSDADGTEVHKCAGNLMGAMKNASAQPCKERISVLIKGRLAKELHSFAEQFAKFRSADGYGKTKWGMTSAEVRKAVPGLPKNTTAKMDTIAGRHAMVAYGFTANRLTMIVVAFTDHLMNAQRYLDDFGDLTAVLSEKYGAPIQNGVEFSSSVEEYAYSDTPAMAISLGHAKATAEWQKNKTRVAATCAATGSMSIATAVIYSSMELAEWAEKHANREAAKNF